MKKNNSEIYKVQTLLTTGLKLHQTGNGSEAWIYYQKVLQIEPNNFDALHLSGLILAAKKDFTGAVNFISKAISINGKNAQAYNNLGITYHESGEHKLAIKNLDLAIDLNRSYVEAYYNRGLSFQALKNYDKAINDYLHVTQLEKNHIGAINNLGNIYQEIGRLDDAIQAYDKAIQLDLPFAEPYNNRGNIFHKQQKYGEALNDFNAAIKINPSYAEAYGNRANTHHSLGGYAESLRDYDKALSLKDDFPGALHNRANLYCELGRLQEAQIDYLKALCLSPNFDYLLGVYFATKMRLCDWGDFDEIRCEIFQGIDSSLKVSQPFWLVAWTDSIAIQKKAAEIWVNEKYSTIKPNYCFKLNKNVSKLRIGYFSADFHDHATMHLMAELFELHDRDRFELIGFSFGPNKPDAMRARIISSLDEFYDVRLKTDAEVAALSIEMGINIAVDLKGYTQNYRAGIFANRAAPIQVNFLGYPGTMAAKFIDYIIADRVVIPESLSHLYSEKVAYLPDCYQVNDRSKKVSNKKFNRVELGLPLNSFVFCCFNNNYKITPEIFDGWMRILLATNDSVLWLYEDNDAVPINLYREAERRGVNPARLIFAKRMPLSEHLSRHSAADLFLDTFPCNAHTTASDALWAGLPILTRQGEAFASRVASSLLHSVGLSDLVVNEQSEYEKLAIKLAETPALLNKYRQALQENLLKSPLFDTKSYAKNLESLYESMFKSALN